MGHENNENEGSNLGPGQGTKRKKKCVTKADLAMILYESLPIDRQSAINLVDTFIELIKQGLEEEGKVMLSGFGSFDVKSKPARKGRNPQTNEPMILRARKVVRFKPSQILRKAVNVPQEEA